MSPCNHAGSRMTTAQFFVYRRPVAWTALVATLVWGGYAYFQMPQRHDPIIPVRIGTVVTIYPGADASRVEQELTRKIEKRVTENASVEKVHSLSRENLSVVFVELFDTVKQTEVVWQDIQNRLAMMKDLPSVHGRPLQPVLDKEFGETVAVMLTISGPKVSDFEVEARAKCIRRDLTAFRESRAEPLRKNRVSAVLVYPPTVSRSYVQWLGNSLLRRMTEKKLIADGQFVESTGAGSADFQVAQGVSDQQIIHEALAWERDTAGTGSLHADMWPGVLIRNLNNLETKLVEHLRDPLRRPDRYGYRDLHRFAELVRDRLKASSTIGQIDEIGNQREAIYLYYSSRRFAALDLAPRELMARIEARNINLPAGHIEMPNRDLVVRPSGEFRSEQDIGNVVIDSREGYPLYLRDVVDLVRSYEDPPSVMNFRCIKPAVERTNDKHSNRSATAESGAAQSAESGTAKNSPVQTYRAITLAVRQIKGTQIEQFGRDIDGALQSLAGVLPTDVRIEKTHDEPREVQEKILQFDQNLVEAMLIVVVVALLLMEWRSALLVAFSIPLTVAMTLGMCQLLGIDLQQVSLAAMIIALGLLVDDPVVAGDAINRELAHGVPRDIAAWQGPQKLARAILYATLTNCVAFLPLLLVKGRVGDFIYSLPVVVTASLVASRIVSMTFMPLLGYYILKGQKGFEASLNEKGRGATFARYYNGFSEWCLRHKALSLFACALMLGSGAAAISFINTAFFPKDLHRVFAVNLFLPEGSPLRQTRDEAIRVVQQIEALEGTHIDSYTAFVGRGGPRFWLSIVPEQRADNYAQILVHTSSRNETVGLAERLKQDLPRHIAAGRITVEQLETGPPIGIPVQLRIYGSDIEALRQIASQVKEQLRQIPGTENIHDDWDAEVLQMSAEIDTDKANMSGVTNEDIALLLQSGLSGVATTYLREQDRLIPVLFRLRNDERTRMDDLQNLDAVSGSTNRRMPLGQLARFNVGFVAPKICRRDHQRCITVKCDAGLPRLPSQVVRELKPRIAQLAGSWPAGYRYEFGGEYEEQAKGFQAVSLALVVSLVVIYLALVMQFNSVTKPLVVFAAVPFGLVAGITGLLPFNAPFGFMAFLGVASLAGVIVSHIIVLFDYIEEAAERGESLHRAVIDSALVRLRPVLVTVLATVGGLIPLALEGGPLWQPMCYVQIAGLLFATGVTKVIVPVLYVVFVEDLKLIHWPSSEAADQPALPEPDPVAQTAGLTDPPILPEPA